MIPLITPGAMRAMEQDYFEMSGTASIELMERAARALTNALLARRPDCGRVFIACGPGGNGGDGLACARMLVGEGRDVTVFLSCEPKTPDARENYRRAIDCGVKLASPKDEADAPDVWVDALYGTGLSRAPEGEAADLIGRMNADRARGSFVAAADIPSGLNGLTGRAFAPCVRADATYTFMYMKPGCVMGDGHDVCGELRALDIGVPASYYPEGQPYLIDDADVRALLPRPRRNIHKGDCGRLLIVAGSFGMAGAAALAAQSALKCGAGLVTVACPASVVPMLQVLAPCAMCAPMPERDGALSEDAAPMLIDLLAGTDAVVCGCGLSRRASKRVVEAVLSCGKRALLDADALNLISESDDLKALLKPHHLITPHPGEAARLLGRAMGEPIGDAFALRALGAQALLKGATTIVPTDGRAALSVSGCAGMAKGGSGDCLSGVIGALMAQRRDASLAECAAVGSEIHGLAGEAAQAKAGIRGMTALDLVSALPEVLMRYE